MKEMIYDGCRRKTVLADSTYKDYHYVILSLGTHPCGYVEIPENSSLYKKNCEEINIDCHYGVTYSDFFLTIEDGREYSGWFIGWDYAHLGDCYCSRGLRLLGTIESGKKWTTQEIVDEAKSVIEQIIEIDSLT